MTIRELIHEIETTRFEVRYSVTTSIKLLELGLEDDSLVQQLIDLLSNDNNQVEILNRILILADDYIINTIHPNDIFVTVYLFALNKAKSYGAIEKATNVVLNTDGFYWANKYAKLVLQKSQQTHNQVISFKKITSVTSNKMDVSFDLIPA